MNVYALPLSYCLDQENITIFPALISNQEECILVDCGYPGSLPALEDAFNTIGLTLNQVKKVIITHHDHDHIGSLREIEQKCPQIEIFCSSFQLPYLTGKEKSLRVQQAEQELRSPTIPIVERQFIQRTMEYLLTIEPVHHAQPFPCDDAVSWCEGIEIIDTKGHMPGHISVYVKDAKTLIAGDALVVEHGTLCCSAPQYVLNMTEALESIATLLKYPFERIICYHGGEYTHDIKNSLQKILTCSRA